MIEMVEQACNEQLTERIKNYVEGMRLRGRLEDGSWYDVEIYEVEIVVSNLTITELEISEEQR